MKYNTLIYRIYTRILVSLRNWLNPYLAHFRLEKLHKKGIKDDFSIISNNCWGGVVYQHFGLPYSSPTVGLFIFSSDYVKFVYHIKEYLSTELVFIRLDESRYVETLKRYGGECLTCPIARCGDIEIIFMHYQTPEEADEKWKRRASRINWNNVVYKFSEMNLCTKEDLQLFDAFQANNKITFTHTDYGLKSQYIYSEFADEGFIPNDTDHFKKYIDLFALLSK